MEAIFNYNNVDYSDTSIIFDDWCPECYCSNFETISERTDRRIVVCCTCGHVYNKRREG